MKGARHVPDLFQSLSKHSLGTAFPLPSLVMGPKLALYLFPTFLHPLLIFSSRSSSLTAPTPAHTSLLSTSN